MRVIITIGGGAMALGETTAIDKAIIKRSGKRHPRLLFIPTASSDDLEYWKTVQRHFGRKLKCRTDVLLLLKERPSLAEIGGKILGADIIYVGGGNTLKMMRLWRRRGVDRLLRQAYQRGTVCCGLSAGSICWYESGHSDSMAYYNPKRWKYINVRGLGLIRGIHCPHYDSHTLKLPRRSHFHQMIKKTGGTGIAIENCCAIEFVDGKMNRVLTSKKGAGAYWVARKRGKIVEDEIKLPGCSRLGV